jgi:hypothetical protein
MQMQMQKPKLKNIRQVALSLTLLGILSTQAQEVQSIIEIRGLVSPETYAPPEDSETLYTVEGVVYSHINLTGSANGLFYMQDSSAGIAVFHTGAEGVVPAYGDQVRITAPLSQFRGLLQLAPDASIATHAVEILSSSQSVEDPLPLDLSIVESTAAMELLESRLVELQSVTITDDIETFPSSGNLTVEDSLGRTFTLRIDSRTDIGGALVPKEPINIIGSLGQFDSSEPYSTGYQILPSRLADLGIENNVDGLTEIVAIRAMLDPIELTPTDTETIFTVRGVVSTHINLTGSSNGLFYLEDDTAGIAVFHSGAAGVVPAYGDLVEIKAPVSQFNGLLQLNPSASNESHAVTIIESGHESDLDPLELLFSLQETPIVMDAIEGMQVIAKGVTITGDGATFPRSGNLTLTDANGLTFTLRIDSRTDFLDAVIPEGTVDVVGVLAQFDSSAPFTEGYQILPSRLADINDGTIQPEITPIGALRALQDPTDLVPPGDGTLYTVRGVVNTHVNLTGTSNGLFYMQDETGGVAVFNAGAGGVVPAFGDLVEVTAPLTHFNGLLQLNPNASEPTHNVQIIASEQTVEPFELALGQLGTALEVLESRLAVIRDVTISGASDPAFPNSANLTLTDATGNTLTLRIDSRTNIGGSAIPEGPVDVIGVIGQFDNSAPHDSGYQILPSRMEDVGGSNNGGGDNGTPKTIQELRGMLDENYEPTDTTTLFSVEGVVTTHINLTTESNGLFYMQDGDYGIAVFHAGAAGVVPAFGDRVRVIAPVTQFNGLLELVPDASDETTSVTVLSSGNATPEPVELDFNSAFDPAVIDALEGRLVKATDVTIDISNGTTFPTGGNLTLTDSFGGTFTLRVDARTDIGGQAVPEGLATIIGPLAQFDTSAPRTEGYQILPSRYADIESALKAPTVEFTNEITNLVREGDLPLNSYTELVMRPGETLTMTFSATDSSGSMVTVSSDGSAPDSAVWTLPDGSGAVLEGSLTLTVSEADAGQFFEPTLVASNNVAENRLVISIYVPTVAEQHVMIGEFLANASGNADDPHFNPLQRTVNGPEDYDPRSDDEYIELVNIGTDSVELGGWSIEDAVQQRHRFFNSFLLAPGSAMIVYGGPLNGFEPGISVPFIPASADAFGFGANNGGDTFLVRNADGRLVERVVYTADQTSPVGSTTRFPTLNHGFVRQDWVTSMLVSPGSWYNGDSYGDPAPILGGPEDTSVTISGEGAVELVWTAEPGRGYTIWSAEGLGSGFRALFYGVSSETESGTFIDNRPVGESDFRFYRVTTH